MQFFHLNSDAEDIFADTNSIDAVPSRPNVRRGVRFMSAIQISDDEMDAVCILLPFFSLGFSYVVLFRIRILNDILNQIHFDMKLSKKKNNFFITVIKSSAAIS